MKQLLVIILIAVGVVAAADITLSKDSLKVYNNPIMSWTDGLIVKNVGNDTVYVDSATLLFDEFDTTGLWSMMEMRPVEAAWQERYADNGFMDYMWKMNPLDEMSFSLESLNPTLEVRKPLTTAPGDSTALCDLQIGSCFVCSVLPAYPQYLRGKLRLYFSSATVVDIRLYSDDLRSLSTAQPCSDYACDSMNVRKILDRNGMESVPVSEVSTSGNGRITALQLRYSEIPMGAITLPKPVTVIPDEIGNLTALISISAGGNEIGSISNKIGRCSNLRSIYAINNGITELPDSIVNCPSLQHLSLENNRLTRLPDSIGKMKALRELNVTQNLLTSLPASMAELDSIRCVFIAENRICALPDAVIARLADVRAKMYCAAFEPVWPDSQECSVGLAGRADTRNMPAVSIVRVVHSGGLLSVETGMMNYSAVTVELSDVAGRLVRQAAVSGAPIRLSTRGLARGVYYLALVLHGRIIGGRPILIDR